MIRNQLINKWKCLTQFRTSKHHTRKRGGLVAVLHQDWLIHFFSVPCMATLHWISMVIRMTAMRMVNLMTGLIKTHRTERVWVQQPMLAEPSQYSSRYFSSWLSLRYVSPSSPTQSPSIIPKRKLSRSLSSPSLRMPWRVLLRLSSGSTSLSWDFLMKDKFAREISCHVQRPRLDTLLPMVAASKLSQFSSLFASAAYAGWDHSSSKEGGKDRWVLKGA